MTDPGGVNGRSLSGATALQILDQIPVGVFVTAGDGSPSYANATARTLLGDGDLLSGSTIAAVYGAKRAGTSDPYPDEATAVWRALSGETSRVDDMEIERIGAPPVVIEVAAGPIHDSSGGITHAAAAFWDVTSRHELDLDRSLLAAIVASTGDAIVSVDLAGRITSWNPAAATLYGYGPEEALGAPLAMLLPVAEAEALDIARLMSEPINDRRATRIHKDGSELTVEESTSAIRTGQGLVSGAAMISRNAAQRLAAEEALDAARRELECKNRDLERSNNELEQFAYVASHDLSEPLRAVAGMVGLLARRYGGQLDDDADEFIAFAVEGCARMRAMIEDLLAFSRAGRTDLKLAPVDANALARGVVDSLRTQIEDARATVEVSDLPVVSADRSQLAQVLQNLMSNAMKFCDPDRPPTVRVSASPLDGFWRFDVTDNGIGIDPAYRSKIFGMFQRLHTRDTYPGTGMGLAIAERIIDRHGGRLYVNDTAGEGATFSFTVPAVAPEETT